MIFGIFLLCAAWVLLRYPKKATRRCTNLSRVRIQCQQLPDVPLFKYSSEFSKILDLVQEVCVATRRSQMLVIVLKLEKRTDFSENDIFIQRISRNPHHQWKHHQSNPPSQTFWRLGDGEFVNSKLSAGQIGLESDFRTCFCRQFSSLRFFFS